MPYDDLLSALYAHLATDAAVVAAFTSPAGNLAIFTEDAGPGGGYPYLVIGDYEEDDPGESLEDSSVGLTLILVHDSLDELWSISRVVKNAVDSPAINPASTRTDRLTWDGGYETGVVRRKSRPRKVKARNAGINAASSPYAWREDIAYEFDTYTG